MKDELPDPLADYIERSRVALAISTAEGDVPLVLVNESFCTLTGYDRADVEGRNCRLLQGDETDREGQRALHDFVHDDSQDDGRFPIVNYRKDGSTFRNLVFMSRLRARGGTTRFILASQFDMSAADRRRSLRENDAELSRNLADIHLMGQQFGLAMEGSAKAISDSVAMLAKLHLNE